MVAVVMAGLEFILLNALVDIQQEGLVQVAILFEDA